MSVTLKDLAKASGVSIGTVSRALNDKNEVSAKTSERIRQLAQELGYIPNRAGRALSAQKSINYVGITIPSINSPFFDDLKKGIDQALREFKDLGIDIVLKEQEGWDVNKQIEA
ncbi:MAG: LacI family DNA-binding transcriptional regulator, partial [Succinivibrio sp.]|nr:LacI family DNA-binding transcriptional regulator [Succinivibrio sp.]